MVRVKSRSRDLILTSGVCERKKERQNGFVSELVFVTVLQKLRQIHSQKIVSVFHLKASLRSFIGLC